LKLNGRRAGVDLDVGDFRNPADDPAISRARLPSASSVVPRHVDDDLELALVVVRSIFTFTARIAKRRRKGGAARRRRRSAPTARGFARSGAKRRR